VRLPRDVYNNLGAEEFKRLVENRTFGYIYDELQHINKTIIAYFGTHELAFDDATYSELNPKTGKKRNERQKLAWIYQALEAMAMKQFAELAQQEPLLTTHDCLYFKQKLPASVVLDATVKLQDTFTFLRFEHEPIFPIAEQDQFEARRNEVKRVEAEHRRFIAEQTELAEMWCATQAQRSQLVKLNATPISCAA